MFAAPMSMKNKNAENAKLKEKKDFINLPDLEL